ncbi:hypothetical protein AALC25_10975 [Lachnospiraceae bacterium 29-84]
MKWQENHRKAMVLKIGVLCGILAAIWYILPGGRGLYAVASVLQEWMEGAGWEPEMGEVPASYLEQGIDGTEIVTSTGYRYEDKFQDTLSRYRYFASLYQPEYSTAVPGLESTDVLGSRCGQMVPQGICIAGDYMLVTAYDNSKKMVARKRRPGYQPNRSVVYVLSNRDPRNRTLLATIVLPDANHVGGIAFDGQNVWIAKSTDRMCSMISYDVIEEAVNAKTGSYELSEYDQDVPCGAIASFVTYFDGKLWVGTYRNAKDRTGSLRSYRIATEAVDGTPEYRLELQDELVIPEYANGAAFTELGGKVYLAVSTSKGRYFHSKIYFYQVQNDRNTGRDLYYCYGIRKFPPMSEELVCYGNQVFLLFESAATCYSQRSYRTCSYLVDRICAFSASDMFWQGSIERIREAAPRLERMIKLAQEERYQEKRYWMARG